MKVQDLLVLFRERAFDQAEPYLWSDDEGVGYADYAQKKAARLLGGIRDSRGELCTLNVPAGSTFIELDPKILKLQSCTVSSTTYTGNVAIEDPSSPYARVSRYEGALHTLIQGEDDGGVRPVNIPKTDAVLSFVLWRLPNDITKDSLDQELEIRTEFQEHLVYAMLERAFMKPDAETLNVKASQAAGETFAREMAQAIRDTKMRRAGRGVVQYGGI